MSQFHIKAQNTGQKAIWYAPAHCVKCGVILETEQVRQALNRNLAPCCSKCSKAVKDQMAADNSAVWPKAGPGSKGWWGRWVKDIATNMWRQE